MSLIDLVEGDENNLLGKFIVYSIFNQQNNMDLSQFDIKNGEIFSLYGAKNFDEFAEKAKLSEEDIERHYLQEELTSIIQKLIPIQGHLGKQIEVKIEKYYITNPDFENEESLLAESGDILFTGRFSHPQLCMDSIKAGMNIYLAKENEQMIKRAIKEMNENEYYGPREDDSPSEMFNLMKQEDLNKKQERIFNNFMEFEGNFKDYIMNIYVNPMLDAKSRNESQEIVKLKNDLIRFSKSSPFLRDVIKLCRNIEENDYSDKLVQTSNSFADKIIQEYNKRNSE